MTDKYCPLRFREFADESAQECIGERCKLFWKCDENRSQSHGEPIYGMPYGNMEPRQAIATEEPQEPREADENANDEDTREKLDAEVRKWCGMYAYQADMVWVWLNRQEAITRAECSKPNWDYCETCELQARVDELTAETIEYDKALDAVKNDRDAWRERFEKANREKCDLQSSGVAQKFNNLCNRLRDKGITISWDDSRSDYWVSFPHDIETISAERDQWRDAAGNAHDMWEKVSAERDELQEQLDKLSSDELHWHSEADYWKRQYELICRAVEDVARNYVIDEGMA